MAEIIYETEAKDLIKNKKDNTNIFISIKYCGIRENVANRCIRSKNNREYSIVVIDGKVIFFCHGCEDNRIVIRNGVYKPVEWLTKRFADLAKKYGNKIYLSCCYGGNKEVEINGIKIIPLNYAKDPISTKQYTRYYTETWRVSSIKDLNKFYKNIRPYFNLEFIFIKSIKVDPCAVTGDLLEEGGESVEEFYYK